MTAPCRAYWMGFWVTTVSRDPRSPFEQPSSFRQNLVTAAELAAAGVPAVPNLYWFRLEYLDRYLSRVGDPRLGVAVNAQVRCG